MMFITMIFNDIQSKTADHVMRELPWHQTCFSPRRCGQQEFRGTLGPHCGPSVPRTSFELPRGNGIGFAVIFGAVVAKVAGSKKDSIAKTITSSSQPGQHRQRAPGTGVHIECDEWQNAESPVQPGSFSETAGKQQDAL